MAAGVLDIVLAPVMLALGPLSDTVLLDFVIAIDLAFSGIALVGLGLGARRQPT